MSKMRIFLLVVVGLAAAAAQNTDVPEMDLDVGEPPSALDVGAELFTTLLHSDIVQHKLARLYEFVDLKIRAVRLVKGLLTRDNLILARGFLDVVARLCNFLAGFLPEAPPDPKSAFLSSLFPVIRFDTPPQRAQREVNATDADRELFERHKDDVVQVARLIYGAP